MKVILSYFVSLRLACVGNRKMNVREVGGFGEELLCEGVSLLSETVKMMVSGAEFLTK